MSAERLLRRRGASGAIPSLRKWWAARSPLARELAVVLLVKAAVLGLLWYAFFRAPVAPHMTMAPQRVEQRLLAPSPASEVSHAVR